MPEEIEVPTEHLHETLHEEAHKLAHHGGSGEGPPSWVSQVALSSAVLAVVAAISALLAGHHANEAMIEQIQASNQWSYYQAKGIKASVMDLRGEVLTSLNKDYKGGERAKVEEYQREQKEIEEKARELTRSSEEHMERHMMLARTVTLLQVAIALSAISVLSRKKVVWFGSLVLGVAGAFFMVLALR